MLNAAGDIVREYRTYAEAARRADEMNVEAILAELRNPTPSKGAPRMSDPMPLARFKRPNRLMAWLRGFRRAVRPIEIDCTGSHSWDAVFDCGVICFDEIFQHEILATPSDRPMRYRCGCGRWRELPARLVQRMRPEPSDAN